MRMQLLLTAGLVAFGLGLAATSAQAAPAGGLVAAVDVDTARASPVEPVTYGWYGRRHRHYGHHHGWYGHGYGKWYKYGYYRPHRYHYGYYRPYRHHYGHYGYRRSWY